MAFGRINLFCFSLEIILTSFFEFGWESASESNSHLLVSDNEDENDGI